MAGTAGGCRAADTRDAEQLNIGTCNTYVRSPGWEAPGEKGETQKGTIGGTPQGARVVETTSTTQGAATITKGTRGMPP